MLHDAHAKCSPNLTADGLTSQSMFDIATQYMLYVRRERTDCILPDFPIRAPTYQDGHHAHTVQKKGREPGRFDHLHDDTLCMVLCVVWVIKL